MHTAYWILLGAVLGTGCGWAALFWAYRMLRARKREEWLSPTIQRILIIAAGICGGGIGFCTGRWLPLLFLLAVFTVGMAVAVSDWLCSIIPNPTVLTVLGLKIVLIAAALLHLPSAPSFDVLSALGGMAFCFLVFSAPSLMGKRIGAGDIKLAAAMGFLLGFGDSLLAIFFMGLLMLAYCVFQRKMPLLAFLKTNIPMGPFIAAGMMIACALPYLSL